MEKGYTRKGNPCMKHYQGMKHIKRYAKGGDIKKAIFQAGAVFARLLDDDSLTLEEKKKLENKFYRIETKYNLF